ncbi:hypothetical protein BN1013_01484 [Candidatus Rubidus massiliensis]|nr:MAG: hypothetical protein BGO10_04805 [Chlamydia sp. 32-24]CDZ80956.1 hypothetical protein BN1013_01484 [Candidatus Rubidus massiliensis]
MVNNLDNGFVKFCSALPLVGDILNPIAQNSMEKLSKNAAQNILEPQKLIDTLKAKHDFAKARVAKDVIGLTSAIAAFALLFFVFTPPVSALIGLIIAGTIAAAGVYYLVDGIIAAVRLKSSANEYKGIEA